MDRCSTWLLNDGVRGGLQDSGLLLVIGLEGCPHHSSMGWGSSLDWG